MSTIKISELATSNIALTDFLAKADANGVASKNTVQELSNLLKTVDDTAFKGSIAIADIPSENGWYFASESGTYTNCGGLVIDTSDNIAIIIISGTFDVFNKIDIPVNITIDAVPTSGSTNAVQSEAVSYLRDFRNFNYTKNEDFAFSDSDILSNPNDVYVFNQRVGGRLTISNFYQDLSTLALSSWYTIYLKSSKVKSFLEGDSTIQSIANSEIIISKYNDASIADTLGDDSIVLFYYENIKKSFNSPFITEKTNLSNFDANKVSLVDVDSTEHKITKNGNDLVFSWKGGIRIVDRNTGNRDYLIGSTSATHSVTVTTNSSSQCISKIKSELLTNNSNITPTLIGIYDEITFRDIVLISAFTDKPTGLLVDFFTSLGITPTWKLEEFKLDILNNLHSKVYDKLPKFIESYAYGTGTGENFSTICMLGDSLFARETHTDVGNVIPSENPPTLTTKNIGAYLNDYIQGQKPIYSRYDKTGTFTEVGTFTAITSDASWDDNGDRPVQTKVSTTASASVEFTTDKPYFNFIDRIDELGTDTVTIDVNTGDGRVEARLEGGTSWLEANAFTFSQNKSDYGGVDAGVGLGNTRYQRRVELRKIGTGIGSNDTIKFSKANDSTRLLYWGLEEIEKDKPYTKLINGARGGHRLDQLFYYVEDDIYSHNPDLVIIEIPLLNMIDTDSTIDYNVNQVHDYIWGDRAGNNKAHSLKNKSNNWNDFNVLLVLPHFSQNLFNTDGTFKELASGYTAEEIYKAIKGFVNSKGDLPIIDMSSIFLNHVKSDYKFNDLYLAMGSSGNDGDGYFSDSVHQNNKGTKVWAKNLCPLLQLN